MHHHHIEDKVKSEVSVSDSNSNPAPQSGKLTNKSDLCLTCFNSNMDSNKDASDTSTAFLTSTAAVTSQISPLSPISTPSNSQIDSAKHLMSQQYYYPFGDDNLKDSKSAETKPPPPSHLRDALVKEEDQNSIDNVEKAPKRKKNKREIIRPDPKYKGL